MSPRDRGAAVVTGASSGIGEACAKHLASLGFRVFAGVRKDADAERLRASGSDRVTPIKLELTDLLSIRTAADQVRAAAGEELAGLVNNAGIAVSGPIEFIPIEELRRQLEVNVIGQVAVTQAFLPALRRARGRVVNIGSIGGRVALPLLGPYAASKFALEGLTDSLRRELRHLGIEVSIVEPGSMATPIWEKGTATADSLQERMPPEAEQVYGDLVDAVRSQAARAAERADPPAACMGSSHDGLRRACRRDQLLLPARRIASA